MPGVSIIHLCERHSMLHWHTKPGRVFVTSGTGYGKTELSAFDAAEINANIVSANAVKVTSFVPPGWQIITSKKDLPKYTDNGVFIPMAYASAIAHNQKVAASLSIGINQDKTKASIIAEHADTNITKSQSLKISQLCVEETFASRSWKLDRIENCSVEAAPENNQYVCALVAALFIVDENI